MQPFPGHSVLKSSGQSILKLPKLTMFQLFSSCCRPAAGGGPSVHFSPTAPALCVRGRRSTLGHSHFFPSWVFSFGAGVERGDKGTKEAEGIQRHETLPGGEKQVPLSAFLLTLLELLCLMWLLGMRWSLRCPSTCLGVSGP